MCNRVGDEGRCEEASFVIMQNAHWFGGLVDTMQMNNAKIIIAMI
jgi:hypothetical protein